MLEILKRLVTREAKPAPAMHAESFSEYIGKYRSDVKKAIKESGSTAAGQKELNWLMKKKNWDSPEASQFKDGYHYFFFGAADLDRVPIVMWNSADKSFYQIFSWFNPMWARGERAVLRD